MQSRISVFEIESPATNGIYVAKDTRNDSSVKLYEWTPPAKERDAAKNRLNEVLHQIDCEVFTADPSFYMVAKTPEEAEQAFAILQKHELFPGYGSNSNLSRVAPQNNSMGDREKDKGALSLARNEAAQAIVVDLSEGPTQAKPLRTSVPQEPVAEDGPSAFRRGFNTFVILIAIFAAVFMIFFLFTFVARFLNG